MCVYRVPSCDLGVADSAVEPVALILPRCGEIQRDVTALAIPDFVDVLVLHVQGYLLVTMSTEDRHKHEPFA